MRVKSARKGTALDERSFARRWERLRRRAQAKGIRPLKLHAARHTWATLALQAGKNIRWVADPLGHADPALTLRVYAHAMREAEPDLSFVALASPDVVIRRRPLTRVLARTLKSLESLVGRRGSGPEPSG